MRALMVASGWRVMEQPTEIAQPRPIFGRRKVVTRATVVDGKTHNRVFLTEALRELGLIAQECRAEPCSIMDTAPDLVVLGISGGDAVEISRILHCLADAAFDGSILAIGPTGSVLVTAIQQLCSELGLAMLTPLATPFSIEALKRRIAPFLGHGDAPHPVIDVAEALKLGWLELWYQQKVDARSLLARGAEALVRIRHPAWGVVAPADSSPITAIRASAASPSSWSPAPSRTGTCSCKATARWSSRSTCRSPS